MGQFCYNPNSSAILRIKCIRSRKNQGNSLLCRIDIRHGKHSPLSKAAILCESILSFLLLAPWIAFIYNACLNTNGMRLLKNVAIGDRLEKVMVFIGRT